MANLITEKQKKAIKVDYYTRLFSVSLIVPISLLGVFLLAYVIPYYISVSKKDMQVAEQFNSVINVENKENIGESSVKIIAGTSDEMKTLELYAKTESGPSAYFSKIVSNKNPDIQITKLSFSNLKNGQGQFFVSGISKTREGLVAFIDDLKSKASFGSVDSPISNFANNGNIPFTLNIKTAI